MGHADNIPGNVVEPEYISNPSFVAVLVILCVLVLVTVILIFIIIESRKTIKKLKEPTPPITEKEQELIYKYRTLNAQNKSVIDDTINALTHNSIDNDYQNDGN
ncbi:MAG: hypothetical protein K2K60_01480 [Clostridia bacterium]|nr:hypothetical protein [Clostridia bacterium]